MEDKVIKETIKKSILVARDSYDYKWMVYPQSYLLAAQIQEEKEELHFTYDTEGRVPLKEGKKEDVLLLLLVLESIGGLWEGRKKYKFSLGPENLYYDQHGSVKIKERDIPIQGKDEDDKEFLKEYKAIIGFALQKKYQYEDFLKGGLELLGKDQFLGRIRELQSVGEIQEYLREEYDKIKTERTKNKVLLPKNRYAIVKNTSIALGTLLLVSIGFLGYYLLIQNPYKEAAIQLSNAYLESDYVGCVDAMKKVEVKQMNLHQKYMLANAYVRSEDLTQEQKTNILESMTLKDSVAKLEYWIYLGRLDADKAEDIALQQSDNQLLLYAYMKKKAKIEDDTKLSGSEKSTQLQEIIKKMEPLVEKYDIEEE